MAEPGRWLVVVPVSESFGTAVGDLARDLGLEVAEVGPDCRSFPAGAVGCVVLAGGAEVEALDLLEALPRTAVPCWLVGASTDYRVASAAVRRGATDYFALPADFDLLRRTVERAAAGVEAQCQSEAFAVAERRAVGFDAIQGRSVELRQVLDQARRVAAHPDVTVLLGGETGTGKELLARAIHYHSPRARAPFVEINCAAIPDALIESELFGHERGAFTGAVETRVGLFELADGGTIFLDEIGHLPRALQPKLLRALESHTIRRVGGREIRPVDVRVLSATHVDLAAAVRDGEFREDLFYRLNVVALIMPPLRHRGGDVELLAEAFLSQLASSYGLPVPLLGPEARAILRRHPWPGNVRELRNAIERTLVLSPLGTLATDLLLPDRPPTPTNGMLPFPATLRAIGRAAALAMLERAEGNKSEAARRLGISRPRLQRLIDGEPD